MTQSDRTANDDTTAPEDITPLLDAFGITVTEEGKARARQRLAEAEARWTPERWAALRTQIGADRVA